MRDQPFAADAVAVEVLGADEQQVGGGVRGVRYRLAGVQDRAGVEVKLVLGEATRGRPHVLGGQAEKRETLSGGTYGYRASRDDKVTGRRVRGVKRPGSSGTAASSFPGMRRQRIGCPRPAPSRTIF